MLENAFLLSVSVFTICFILCCYINTQFYIRYVLVCTSLKSCDSTSSHSTSVSEVASYLELDFTIMWVFCLSGSQCHCYD